MQSLCYPLSLRHLGRARVDVLTAALKVALCSPAYTPADTHEWFADVAAGEVTGGDYAAGGQLVTGRTFEYDPVLAKTVLRCDPVSWDIALFTLRYAVLYADTGDPGTSALLSYADLGAGVQLGGVPLRLTYTAGAYRLGRAT